MDLTNVQWRKARRSANNGGNCVEVAVTNGTKEGHTRVYAIRDSKDLNPNKVLTFTPTEWNAFRLSIKDGELDDLT
ncbi:DUF397 domain-containing protein [Nonomuraea longicatena]|uniref:DUF397 domain-containing protein n=1 Tax=Nonomuraea longicatena TaxID=83682 RepID=A0ABN1NQY3_9ACTN